MSFSILFKFEINNERGVIIICQCLTLIDNIKSFLLIKNSVKSEAWLLLNYDRVSYPVLGNNIYWWNIRHDYMAFSFIVKEKELMNSWWWSWVFETLKHFLSLWISLSFIAINHSLHYVLLKVYFNQASDLNR
jgi:hypothetical protein